VDDEEGVDMGMDLCVTGVKAPLHVGTSPSHGQAQEDSADVSQAA
jgi:hypothetical protein